MSLEQSIQNLAEAINKLAEATRFAGSMTGANGAITTLAAAAKLEDAVTEAVEAPKRRGRPPGKKSEPVATVEEFPAEEPTTSAPAAPVAPASIDVATLRHTLIEVVKQKGRDACGELCRKHGGPNLSALNPAVYPALYADAQALLATDTP